MRRRVPYIIVSKNKISYICPSCGKIIPLDYYKMQDYCPYCDKSINRTSKGMMRTYQLLDKDLYDYFHIEG